MHYKVTRVTPEVKKRWPQFALRSLPSCEELLPLFYDWFVVLALSLAGCMPANMQSVLEPARWHQATLSCHDNDVRQASCSMPPLERLACKLTSRTELLCGAASVQLMCIVLPNNLTLVATGTQQSFAVHPCHW